jgi:hypothetical protein
MREREQAFCFTGKDIRSCIAKQGFYLRHTLRGPVEKVDLDKGSACLLEPGNLAGGQGRRIAVYRDNRVAGSTEQGRRHTGGPSCTVACLFPEQVIERLAATMGDETFP